MNVEGNIIKNRQEIVNIFNKYFLSTAKNINPILSNHSNYNPNNTTPLHYLLQAFKTPFPNFHFKHISTKEVENIIKSLKPKNSSGYDGISTKLLKVSSAFIISPLTYICNKSISSGIFPDRLKYAMVKPLHKKGDRLNVSNYRPISMLSSFSKVFEKVMYNQLQDHLIKFNILAKEQFGFRINSSTDKAIYKLTNEALMALNNKFAVGGIFFYLEKAFDCLNHKILMSKLQFYGITGKAKSWLESYFTNRYQRVQLSDEDTNLSTWEKITDGVPQGSILGPLLFLIYINDLPKILNDYTIPILFADDTSIIVKGSNSRDFQVNMDNTFNHVNKWFKTNLLTINIDKTHYIQFKTKNKPTIDIKIVCNEQPITTAHNIKFLGIYINDSINWNYHIDYIIPKLSTACYIMRNIKSYMPLNTMKTIYYSYFNSIMSYGLPFWGNSPHSQRIFRIQKKIIRIMVGCRSRASCRNLFRELEILPLASQYIYSLLLFVVNNINLFLFNSNNSTKTTRQAINLHQPLTNFTVYQKGVYCMGIKVYNNLPLHIKETSNNPRKFKSGLKQFLHTYYFYTIDEYLQYRSIES